MKKVSVIVPVYNAAEFLAETLDTILNQTLEDIEVLRLMMDQRIIPGKSLKIMRQEIHECILLTRRTAVHLQREITD